jgi:nucleoside-diphosphate-sugar epimerase
VRVLATGTTGTIGKHLSKVVKYEGDVRDPNYGQLDGFESFLHLAGVVGVKNVEKRLQDAYTINVDATIRLAENCVSRNFKQFVYVSTSHVYKPSPRPITEDFTLAPQSEYAAQKLEAESSLIEVFSNSSTVLVIVRVFSILGAGMFNFTLGGLADRIAQGSDEIVNFSSDVRDFLAPNQAAVALEVIARHVWLESGTVNLCTSSPLSVKDAVTQYLLSNNYLPSSKIFVESKSQNPVLIGSNKKLLSIIPELASTLKAFNPSKSAY